MDPALSKLSLQLLPPTIRELVGLAGLGPTLSLVEQFGGITLSIPAGANRAGREILEDLAERIGEAAAEAIGRHYAGTRLYVPNCKKALTRARDARMLELKKELEAEGASGREIVKRIALAYNLSDRYVWRILRMDPKDPKPAFNNMQTLLPGIKGNQNDKTGTH